MTDTTTPAIVTGPMTGKVTTRDDYTIVTTAKARFIGDAKADDRTTAKGLTAGMTFRHPYNGDQLTVTRTVAEPKSMKVHAVMASDVTKAGKPRKGAPVIALWFTNGVIVDVIAQQD